MSTFKLSCWAVLVSTLVSGITYANPVSKQIIYVDFDSQADIAHAQLKLLKKMDVLGVNLNQHWAEVSVTNNELAELQAKKLSIRKANYRLREFNSGKSSYLNPAQVRDKLTDIHTQYPAITSIIETGKTHRKQPILAMEISSTPGDINKPVVLFNAMHHAREVMTPEVVLNIAKVLTEKYGNDAEVTSWLNNYRIVIIPQVNPDGNEIVSQGETMWRSGGR